MRRHLTPSAQTILGALVSASLLLTPPVAAQTSLVIYHDGRVLVRQIVPVALPRGISRHVVEVDQLDPGSLVSLDPGVSITEVDYPRSINEATLYRASVGRRLLFQLPRSPDTTSALLLGDDPPRFKLANGQVSLTAPGTPLFSPELVGVARPTTIVVQSDQAHPRLALGYVTDGVTWNAEYSILVGGQSAEVSGRVAVRSQEVRADSAEINMLEGDVTRASSFQRDRFAVEPLRLDEIVVSGAAPVLERMAAPVAPIGVGGFRMYSVPGRHSLAPGRTTVARLFEPTRVAVERVNLVPSRGVQPGGPEQDLPVEVHYRIARSRESPFGAQAIPPGIARIYSRTSDGSVVLVGEAAVAHADPGAMLDLTGGRTVTLRARRVAARTELVQDTTFGADGRSMITSGGQVTQVEVRFSNVADTLASVEMTELVPSPYRVVSSSVPVEDAGPIQVRFRLTVPARGETILRYRVRVSP